MKRIPLLAGMPFVVFSSVAGAAQTIEIHPGDTYSKIEGAQPGDTVLIHPGTYKFRVHLTKDASSTSPITIKAADPANPPVWDLAGKLVEEWPGSYGGGDKGRGCWQVLGSHYQISGIVFRNCHNASKNSSGIRTNGSQNLTVRDVLFEDNDNGFTGQGEETTIEYCEFSKNGNVDAPASAPTHNIYVFGGTLAVRYSYLHDPRQAQNFHIRARESVLESNYIARAKSYEGDLMTSDFDGATNQTMLFRGNVVVGNPNPANGYQVIALYNDGGQDNLHLDIRAVWNTFVIQAGSNPRIIHLLNDSMAQASATIANNVIVGTTRPYAASEPSQHNFTVTGSNNWMKTGAEVGALTGTVLGSTPGFASDYRLGAGSACKGAANTSVKDAPFSEYFLNEAVTKEYRLRASVKDIGAFESTTDGPGVGAYDDPSSSTGAGGSGSGGGPGGSGGASGTGGSPEGSGGAAGTGGSPEGSGGASGTGGSEAGSGGAPGSGGGSTPGAGGSGEGGGGDPDPGPDGCAFRPRPSSSNEPAMLAGVAAIVALLGRIRRRPFPSRERKAGRRKTL